MLNKLRYPKEPGSEADLLEREVNQGDGELEGLKRSKLCLEWSRMKDLGWWWEQ